MKLPFGKYRGVPVDRAPVEYLEWLVDQDWLRDPLRAAVEEELDRRESLRAAPPMKIDIAVADAIIRSGVRQLAKQHHPDTGANGDQMKKINVVAAQLREMAVAHG